MLDILDRWLRFYLSPYVLIRDYLDEICGDTAVDLTNVMLDNIFTLFARIPKTTPAADSMRLTLLKHHMNGVPLWRIWHQRWPNVPCPVRNLGGLDNIIPIEPWLRYMFTDSGITHERIFDECFKMGYRRLLQSCRDLLTEKERALVEILPRIPQQEPIIVLYKEQLPLVGRDSPKPWVDFMTQIYSDEFPHPYQDEIEAALYEKFGGTFTSMRWGWPVKTAVLRPEYRIMKRDIRCIDQHLYNADLDTLRWVETDDGSYSACLWEPYFEDKWRGGIVLGIARCMWSGSWTPRSAALRAVETTDSALLESLARRAFPGGADEPREHTIRMAQFLACPLPDYRADWVNGA